MKSTRSHATLPIKQKLEIIDRVKNLPPDKEGKRCGHRIRSTTKYFEYHFEKKKKKRNHQEETMPLEVQQSKNSTNPEVTTALDH